MSVRAYKLIEVKHEEKATFNCYQDSNILNHANLSKYDDGGIVEFMRETIEELIADEESDEGLRETAKDILKDFAEDDDYIEYYCY